MHRMTINTCLDGFLLLDRITRADSCSIRGIRAFSNAPAYLGLESLAQLGAFHVRYLTRFERHAFLLKIISCGMPTQDVLNGTHTLSGELISRSRAGFCYRLHAEREKIVHMTGRFLFASMDYDHRFRKERLKSHYQIMFSCLRNDSKES
ncbi:MAG: hypothetical protein DRH37_04130 [Deltaproteobacteria bacterium]|nr:MAG: hypothetical protein DRH37_04130 [Deltaproteobacteria bacterium]